jgi:hypothetical protein
MPVKSGASHGFAAFGTLIIGTMLSKFIWDILPPLGQLSVRVIKYLNELAGLEVPTNEQFAGAVVVMVGLSSLWGVIFHVSRH